MTDEERQKLCDELSQLHVYSDAPERAVAEINRLAKKVEELKRTKPKSPGPDHIPIGGAGNGA